MKKSLLTTAVVTILLAGCSSTPPEPENQLAQRLIELQEAQRELELRQQPAGGCHGADGQRRIFLRRKWWQRKVRDQQRGEPNARHSNNTPGRWDGGIGDAFAQERRTEAPSARPRPSQSRLTSRRAPTTFHFPFSRTHRDGRRASQRAL